MLGLGTRRSIDWCLGKVQIVVSTTVVLFGALLKVDRAQFPTFEPLLQKLQGVAWLFVVGGPIIVAAVQGVRLKFGSPWAWEALQSILDELRIELFGKFTDDPDDYHRVTLFKRSAFHLGRWNEWRSAAGAWDPRGWLVAVARSGHLMKDRIRRFRAPDDADRCEGVVGKAWRRKGWIIIPEAGRQLPTMTGAVQVAAIKTYAEETGVSIEWVNFQTKNGRPLAAVYAAFQVLKKGTPWGVLVIDSRKPAAIDFELLRTRFAPYMKVLSPLLEKI